MNKQQRKDSLVKASTLLRSGIVLGNKQHIIEAHQHVEDLLNAHGVFSMNDHTTQFPDNSSLVDGFVLIKALDVDELSALKRFAETAEDDNSYDLSKEMIAKLAGYGVIRHHSAGKYSLTTVGEAVLEQGK